MMVGNEHNTIFAKQRWQSKKVLYSSQISH